MQSHESRQVAPWLIFDVGQNLMSKCPHCGKTANLFRLSIHSPSTPYLCVACKKKSRFDRDTLAAIGGIAALAAFLFQAVFQLERAPFVIAILVGTFAVIAIPDERAGHGLVPVFELSVSPTVIANVLSLYQAQAPGFRRLQPAAVIERFPRSGLGKLRRIELAAIYHLEFPGSDTRPA